MTRPYSTALMIGTLLIATTCLASAQAGVSAGDASDSLLVPPSLRAASVTPAPPTPSIRQGIKPHRKSATRTRDPASPPQPAALPHPVADRHPAGAETGNPIAFGVHVKGANDPHVYSQTMESRDQGSGGSGATVGMKLGF
ncbi:hypothetical protein [Lichenihabitans psoromatis]|uniref:hypothetical protein n=1 Tax=Lichenihabitans psoromatis TaxID=2528642 RepID=UPI0010383C47|nr:hypothetical protein [Lichenihabitans psoromatis]